MQEALIFQRKKYKKKIWVIQFELEGELLGSSASSGYDDGAGSGFDELGGFDIW